MISYEDLKDNKYTEEEIEKYIDSFTEKNWDFISEHQTLSESFIEKYKDLVDWFYISIYQKLSEPFIEKYKDKVYWGGVFQDIKSYQRISY
jgi:hypothetical protein